MVRFVEDADEENLGCGVVVETTGDQRVRQEET